LNGKIRTAAILAFLVLMFASSIQMVSAIGAHYELDKPYYHPGDTGKLLLVCNNDESYDYTILRAEMNIDGIGTFKWDMSAFPNGYEWKRGQTVNIEIYFRMPADAQPRVYRYTWLIERVPGPLITFEGRLEVCAVGEEPSQSQFPLPLVLIAVPILALAVVVFRRKRGRRTKFSAAPPPSLACPHCSRDLSTLPRDIRNCPYCGKAVSTPSIEAKPAVKVELPAEIKRIRRYTKMTALFGILVAVSFFILIFLCGLGLGRSDLPAFPILRAFGEKYASALWSLVFLGILLAIFSRIIQTNAGTTRFWRRRVAGKLTVVSAIALQIYGGSNLANTAYYPAKSLPYQIGKALLSYVTPVLLVLGIIVYAIAKLAEKKEKI